MKRWTLSQLAQLSAGTPGTARSILQNVLERLEQQRVWLDHLHRDCYKAADSSSTKNIRLLEYLHQDTARLCSQVLASPALSRWQPSDTALLRKTLTQVRDRHASSLERLVDVALETAEYRTQNAQTDTAHDDKISNVFRLRYGILLLADHYVRLPQNTVHDPSNAINNSNSNNGMIEIHQDVVDLLDPAVAQARHVCEAHWLTSPEVHVRAVVPDVPTVTAVQPWLLHALVELTKNGLHATLQRHNQDYNGQEAALPPAPPLEIVVSHDDDYVVVDVLDEGRGLPVGGNSSEILFGIGYSSAHKRWDRLDEQQSYAAVRSPMSSLGVGLPVSRMMMQHFGGQVELLPRNGGGAQARVLLPRRADLYEQLPGVPADDDNADSSSDDESAYS